ncbi:signal transducer and activator of transcription 1-alpha/beta-like [Chanos chanos]|uniref:Signal transducer and activator of transcription n=1 Tax=Chanos chanos TaxID=29144 RepID=A0A6J2WDD9_CHACN|nr:signal transducer and activator of transcription 1-alpha/beta-like [Chanos chanos]
MAQWKQLQQLDTRYLEQVDQLYSDIFPMEIRQYLSQWIESQDWDVVANCVSLATVRFHDLMAQLDEQFSHSAGENNLLLQHTLRKIKGNILMNFQERPVQLAGLIAHFLNEERKILQSALKENTCPSHSSKMMDKQGEFDHKISELQSIVQETKRDIQALEDLQDDYDFRKKTQQTTAENETPSRALKEKLKQGERTIQQMFLSLHSARQAVLMQMTNALTLAEEIQRTLVSEELPKWKRRQQISCIGGPPNACLDQLQNWFTSVTECLQQIRQQLNKLQELVQKLTYENDPITQRAGALEEQTLHLFRSLISNALVVERQPCMPTHPQRPLVLKTSVQFTVKLRLLVKLPEFNCQLKVKATFDKDVTEKSTIKGYRALNCLGTQTKVLNFEESSGCIAAEFRHLQIRENKTVGSRSNEGPLTVSEELHLISFNTQLVQHGITIDIMTTSLPLVVISGSVQMPAAWASILWYNMLCSEPRNLSFFLNPEQATWGQLSELLSWQFSSVTNRGLNPEQLRMLGDKLLGPEAGGNPDELISWPKFCKTCSDRIPSFWHWLHSTLQLIKNHLLDLWNDGLIMGFVNKEQEKFLLKDKQPGTFLLRFSESCRDGGITITFIETSQFGEHEIHSVKPYTKYDLKNLSFADIIHNYKLLDSLCIPEDPLLFLYPDIPKDKAFRPYYSKPSEDASPPEDMETKPNDRPYLDRRIISVSKNPRPMPFPSDVFPDSDMMVDQVEESEGLIHTQQNADPEGAQAAVPGPPETCCYSPVLPDKPAPKKRKPVEELYQPATVNSNEWAENEDELFFLSLLRGSFQRLSLQKRAELKMKFQRIIFEAEFNQ